MLAIIGITAQIVDWRFGIGLIIGSLLTFRYIVVGIYHPIIREMEAISDASKDESDGA